MSFGFYVHGQRKDSADPASDEGIFYEGPASVSYLSFIFFHSTRHLCRIYLLSFFFMKAWLHPLFHFLGAIFGRKLIFSIFDLWNSLSSIYCLWFFAVYEMDFLLMGMLNAEEY